MTCCGCLPPLGFYGVEEKEPLIARFDSPSGGMAYIRGAESQTYSVNDGPHQPLTGGRANISIQAGETIIKVHGRNLLSTDVAGIDLVEIVQWGEYLLRGIRMYKFSDPSGTPGAVGTVSSPFLVKVPNIEPPHATTTESMFRNCLRFNQLLDGWDTSRIRSMASMFYGCAIFNQPLTNFNTDLVENMESMFQAATVFDQPVNHFNTSNVRNMQAMFYRAGAFNQPVSNFDTSRVTSMVSMFSQAVKFNQPVSNFDTYRVINMLNMFGGAWEFNQPLDNFDTINVTNMADMFTGAFAFNQSLSYIITPQVVRFDNMFSHALKFNQPLQHFNVSNATNMRRMFYGAEEFNRDLSNWCVSQFPVEPEEFSQGASAWTLPKPIWGTCP